MAFAVLLVGHLAPFYQSGFRQEVQTLMSSSASRPPEFSESTIQTYQNLPIGLH
ncbi:MAG: hypothetical protein AAFU71_01080 [Cyanobacteria bacterium J06632_22]